MSTCRKIEKGLKNPLYVLGGVIKKLSPYIKDDKKYISLRYFCAFGKQMNWENPQTFNEKLNWMKLYLRNPQYTQMADKYEVKEIVSKIAPEIVVPCYGVWNSFEEIDFDKLPEQFVLKATHDSSGATICRDKNKFNKEKAKNKFDKCLKRNWYSNSKEWVYKNIKPRIIADLLLDDHSGKELHDYKFWCFNGEPKVMYITNKGEHIYENFYDMNFQPLDINHGYPRQMPEYEKPKCFDAMKEYARLLSKGIPFVRVDFFYVDRQVYFGEFTFYDWGGLGKFKDEKWDKKLGSWIELPNKSNE